MLTRSLTLSFVLLSSSAAAVGVAQAAATPQQFITDAIRGDNAEVAFGELAQQKGGNDQVRSLANTLVDDHKEARQQASDLARSLGVVPPSDLTADAQNERNKLSGLSGDAFDREFLTHVIDDHMTDVTAYQSEARDDHGPVGRLAGQQVPVLQRHLQMAQLIPVPGMPSTSAPPVSGFQAQEEPDTWRISKLIGVPVYGPNNAKVGDVNDVLLDHDGKATTIVVGVGGFLGLGEKNVAVPFDEVRFTQQALPPTTPANTAQDGVIGSTGPARQSSTAYPDHGLVNLTAAQLKAAPSFQYAR